MLKGGSKWYNFRSTNEIYLLTWCKPNTKCKEGTFKFEYARVRIEVEEEEPTNWSLYITICIGFSLMFIALLYFEWRTIFKCFLRCKDKMCGRGSQRQIGFVSDSKDGKHGK